MSCWWGAIGCGDDSGDSELDTAAFCAAECEQRVVTNCMATPMSYTQQSCEQMCQARYPNHPQCEAQLKAVDRCLAEQVTYICNASGAIEATPAEACAAEIEPCVLCTSEVRACTL
jgi:hypothetical protein